MKKLLLLIFTFLPSSMPLAQGYIQGNVSLSVTTASARVALPGTLNSTNGYLTILNDGSTEAFLAFGNGSVTATLTGIPLPAGYAISTYVNSTQTNVAAISTGSTTLKIIQANGIVGYTH